MTSVPTGRCNLELGVGATTEPRPVAGVPRGHKLIGYIVVPDEALPDKPIIPIAILSGRWKYTPHHPVVRDLLKVGSRCWSRIALPFRSIDTPDPDDVAVQVERVAIHNSADNAGSGVLAPGRGGQQQGQQDHEQAHGGEDA